MQKALAPEISTWPEENPQLIGSQCGACGATAFPDAGPLSAVQCRGHGRARCCPGRARCGVDDAGLPAAVPPYAGPTARTSCRSASATSSSAT